MQIREFVQSLTSPEDDTLVTCRKLQSQDCALAILAREGQAFFQPWQS